MRKRRGTIVGDVRGFWNRRAQGYDEVFDAPSGDGHVLRARHDATLRMVGTGPGSVMDAGMGPGRLCAELDRLGFTVYGVDTSSAMVALARARLPGADRRLVEGSIEALPFDDESFDRVTATGVLEYSDVPSALRELSRVLRPGGLAVASYPNARAPYRAWKAWVYYPAVRLVRRLIRLRTGEGPRTPAAIGPAKFESMLEAAGLMLLRRELTSAAPLLAPLDTIFPETTSHLARKLERRDGARALFATQVVYQAQKAGERTPPTDRH